MKIYALYLKCKPLPLEKGRDENRAFSLKRKVPYFIITGCVFPGGIGPQTNPMPYLSTSQIRFITMVHFITKLSFDVKLESERVKKAPFLIAVRHRPTPSK